MPAWRNTGGSPPVTVTVAAENEVPALTGLASAVSFAENAAPALLDAVVAFTGGESEFGGGRLVVGGLLAEDRVSILAEGTGAGQIGVSGAAVTYGGITIGTASGGVGGSLVVSFTAGATAAAVDALIQRLAYQHVSDAPTATRSLTLNVVDGAGVGLGLGGPVQVTAALTGTANPFNGIDAGSYGRPAFVDLDGGGDLDLVLGEKDGTLRAWRNTAALPAITVTVTAGNDAPTGAVTLGLQAGTAPLTVRDTLADAEGMGAVSYRWQHLVGATWTDIPGAAGATFAPTAAQAGLVRATASFTDGRGAAEQLASAVTARIGTDGAEALTATADAPFILGLGGNDSLGAGGTAAYLDGGTGNDTVAGGGADDLLTGGAGHDLLRGEGGHDTLHGGSGNDSLLGGAGHDSLDGSTGVDTMEGGAGDDIYRLNNTGDVASEAGGDGSDLVVGSVSHTLGAGIETLQLGDMANLSGTGNGLANRLLGNSGANLLSGGDGADKLSGVVGNDTLGGGSGDDRLDGGTGADSMDGAAGNDTYLVDDAGDVASEAGGDGSDLVIASVSHTLGTGIENLRLTGTAEINGAGNGLANRLLGNTGANLLGGGAGIDTLSGGGGADILVYGRADEGAATGSRASAWRRIRSRSRRWASAAG